MTPIEEVRRWKEGKGGAVPLGYIIRVANDLADALEAAERERGELENDLSKEIEWRLEVQAEYREQKARADKAERALSEALAREAGLRKTVAQAAAWLREYEAGHLAKGTESGNDKAARNGRRAKACEAALSTPSPRAEAMPSGSGWLDRPADETEAAIERMSCRALALAGEGE